MPDPHELNRLLSERADTLIFKRLKAPSLKEFDTMVEKGHARAKKLKLTSKDLEEVRKRSR